MNCESGSMSMGLQLVDWFLEGYDCFSICLLRWCNNPYIFDRSCGELSPSITGRPLRFGWHQRLTNSSAAPRFSEITPAPVAAASLGQAGMAPGGAVRVGPDRFRFYRFLQGGACNCETSLLIQLRWFDMIRLDVLDCGFVWCKRHQLLVPGIAIAIPNICVHDTFSR